MEHRLRGVGVALITPFDENNNIDFAGLLKLMEFNAENGTDYFVVNGTTGESATTTNEEKLALLDFVKKNNRWNLPIVYGVGSNNTADVIHKLKTTDLSGVEAVLSVCPYYNKPSQAGITAHFQAIADASPLPVILYNVPGRTVATIQVPTAVELAKHPNIIGLKDASCSMEMALELTKKMPENFILLSGDDNLVSPQISLGFQGVISVIANGFPKEFAEMTHAALNGDFKTATKIQNRFHDFDTLLYVESNPVGIKMVCEIRGICDGRVRLPLVKATDGLRQQLIDSMKKEGFL
ncbi:MAG: 4-hydroxy-tetrahydrodipicolinate synthase [Cytophagaceae bacterium]|nr:4-hydroxy-tetrahydrodipicolinate synthase [Cytophagaceae bacterium]MBK9936439.1 4-hydroxy-tetrahydrodipicolinate synthase [Cytophagaceae bacterium]MBL0300188.1 4-hydroxy-tetrahydrodipicolinate synthase [Cytophagaceae bacterium]MBL0327124.1 4-hydroxy-tetrahydrodipicolinate synthase [Cytophagaceae bacterium]